jgi:nucleotide sugar dehydrogenase
MSNYLIGIIGIGVLGTAILETFTTIVPVDYEDNNTLIVKCYDKYKNIGNSITELLDCNMIFLCLPTEFDKEKKEFDKLEIYKVCKELNDLSYDGVVILKSTIEPKTTTKLSTLYSNLNIVHNPEFLSAKTATEDFMNQSHIVIGIITADWKPKIVDYLKSFFSHYFPNASISICLSDESESMKLCCNSFYATKIQFFTEIKLLCDSLSIDFDEVVNLMLANKWINPMHTMVPGHDGNISFGGKCLPKDISALNSLFEKMKVSHEVIQAVIKENKQMRPESP